MKTLNSLPPCVQDEVRDMLRAYNTCNVYKHLTSGDYSVTVGSCLSATYTKEKIAAFSADQVFTTEEKIENYINTFGSYPIEYSGKRDYIGLRDKTKKARMIDGAIVFIGG